MVQVKALTTHTYGGEERKEGDVYEAGDEFVGTLRAAKFAVPEDQYEQYQKDLKGTAEEDAAAGITDGGCGAGMPLTEYEESINGVNDPEGQAAAEVAAEQPSAETMKRGTASEPMTTASAGLSSSKKKYSRSDLRPKS